MAKKIIRFLIALAPVLAAGLCADRDDHNQPADQPHDHHENVPAEATPRVAMVIPGINTAAVFDDDSYNPLSPSGGLPLVKYRSNFFPRFVPGTTSLHAE